MLKDKLKLNYNFVISLNIIYYMYAQIIIILTLSNSKIYI